MSTSHGSDWYEVEETTRLRNQNQALLAELARTRTEMMQLQQMVLTMSQQGSSSGSTNPGATRDTGTGEKADNPSAE